MLSHIPPVTPAWKPDPLLPSVLTFQIHQLVSTILSCTIYLHTVFFQFAASSLTLHTSPGRLIIHTLFWAFAHCRLGTQWCCVIISFPLLLLEDHEPSSRAPTPPSYHRTCAAWGIRGARHLPSYLTHFYKNDNIPC